MLLAPTKHPYWQATTKLTLAGVISIRPHLMFLPVTEKSDGESNMSLQVLNYLSLNDSCIAC